MNRRRIEMAAIAMTALALAGCSAGVAPASSLLDNEQTAEDRVEVATVFDTSGFDPETTRLVGQHDDVSFYFVINAEGESGEKECLLAVPASEQDWLGLCNGGGEGSGAGIGVGSFRYGFGGVASAGLTEDEVAVGDYVIVVVDG